MKVVLGMTPWVFIKHLGPKNPRQPNLAAAQETKIVYSLWLSFRENYVTDKNQSKKTKN